MRPSGSEYTGDYNQLVYLRARMYDPASGRFITKDSWQGDYDRPLSLNFWNYVEANPINYSDPTGHGPIHFQVIVRYAAENGLFPEYSIPSTVPNTPPRWPFQRRGKHVDLADLLNFQIWEVEPYSTNGNYPEGHGPDQVASYLNLLNIDADHNWTPGRWLAPQRFTMGAYNISAWWEQPGLIVYQTQLNPQTVVVTSAFLCYLTYARTIEALQRTLRELPGFFPPNPEPIPHIPPNLLFPPPSIPVFILP